jgi:hypothetical protein
MSGRLLSRRHRRRRSERYFLSRRLGCLLCECAARFSGLGLFRLVDGKHAAVRKAPADSKSRGAGVVLLLNVGEDSEMIRWPDALYRSSAGQCRRSHTAPALPRQAD